MSTSTPSSTIVETTGSGTGARWKREAAEGRDEGSKDRPCAVILVVRRGEDGYLVRVIPITHSAPADRADAVEVPAKTAQRLGLDERQSWIVVTEANEFMWPGPDLIPARRGDPSSVAYGMLPPALFRQVRDRLVERYRQKRLAAVRRSE